MEEGIKRYCESNHIYFILIITITFRNGWLGTPMGVGNPQWVVGNLKVPHLLVLHGYAITRLRIWYCINKCTLTGIILWTIILSFVIIVFVSQMHEISWPNTKMTELWFESSKTLPVKLAHLKSLARPPIMWSIRETTTNQPFLQTSSTVCISKK